MYCKANTHFGLDIDKESTRSGIYSVLLRDI